MSAQKNWRFDGRLAFSHQGKGGSARISWLQTADLSDITLSAPLSIGSARIVLVPDSAQIIDSKGNVVAEGDPGAVFSQVLRTPVPNRWLASGLRAFWPGNPDLTASALAGVVVVDQWQWRYLQWQEFPVLLPKRIEIEHGDTRLRIVIDAWQELPDE